jgi:hypothetical protein
MSKRHAPDGNAGWIKRRRKHPPADEESGGVSFRLSPGVEQMATEITTVDDAKMVVEIARQQTNLADTSSLYTVLTLFPAFATICRHLGEMGDLQTLSQLGFVGKHTAVFAHSATSWARWIQHQGNVQNLLAFQVWKLRDDPLRQPHLSMFAAEKAYEQWVADAQQDHQRSPPPFKQMVWEQIQLLSGTWTQSGGDLKQMMMHNYETWSNKREKGIIGYRGTESAF